VLEPVLFENSSRHEDEFPHYVAPLSVAPMLAEHVEPFLTTARASTMDGMQDGHIPSISPLPSFAALMSKPLYSALISTPAP
jgi:hypothetical protein